MFVYCEQSDKLIQGSAISVFAAAFSFTEESDDGKALL
jgi:hypothetical protein